jgi:hypothetical protein
MSFTVSYELFRGDVSTVASSNYSDSAVLIKCVNTFQKVKDGNLFDQKMTFKIPCPDDDFASTVALFIKNRFDSGDSIVFSGTFPHDNFVLVSVPSNFLSS